MLPPLQPLPSPSSAPAVLVAALSDRYALRDYIGSGAEANVWHAIDRLDGAEVAIKHFPPRPGRRALQEFASLLPLRHRHIVPLRDFAYLPGGDMVIISAYIPGGSLRGRLEHGGALPPEQVLRIAEDMLSALSYLHSRGTLHRDIKPDNILIKPRSGDTPVAYLLADFGIAGSGRDAAMDNQVLGSPAYLAPEALVCRVGPAADLYALGVTLYELLEGRRPFENDAASLARAHLSTPPPPLGKPAGALAPLVFALLEKDPARRPFDAAAARTLLHSQRPGAGEHPGPAAGRRRMPSLLFRTGSRLVIRSSFSLPRKVDHFGVVTLGERPALVFDEGSHLALHDAANGSALRIPLPKSGSAYRIDGDSAILRANGLCIQLWDTHSRRERVIVELSRACAGLAWHEDLGLLATVDESGLTIENPGGLLPSVHLRLPAGLCNPHLTWLAEPDVLAVAGGLLRPELRLHAATGALLGSLPLPGAVLASPRHLGAPIWIVLDHGAKARLAALVLDERGALRTLTLPENLIDAKIAPDGLLVALASGELQHLSPDGQKTPLGSLPSGSRTLALSTDARHLLAARPGSTGTEFTLYSHQHG